MADLSDVRGQIKSDLVIIGTDYDAQIDNAIRSALRQLRARKFWFLETITDLTLSATASTLTLPTNFGCSGTFDLITSNIRLSHERGFDFLSLGDLRSLYYTTSPLQTGQPLACAESNGTLYVSHISDVSYTIPAVYYAKDATLPSGDSDESVWFDDGYDVVRSMANYIFKRDSQHYTASEEDGSMVRNYTEALGRQHERREGSR